MPLGGGTRSQEGTPRTCLCRQTANLTGANQLTVLASGVRQEQVALGEPSWTSEFTVPWLQGKQKLPDCQMVQDQTLVSGSLLQEGHLPVYHAVHGPLCPSRPRQAWRSSCKIL